MEVQLKLMRMWWMSYTILPFGHNDASILFPGRADGELAAALFKACMSGAGP